MNLFWNYQIVYGICYDAYYPPPNYNQKFKPWIYWGWTANAAILLIIAILVSNTTDPYSFVVLLTIGNFFEIVAVTAIDGFNSWSMQHELKKQHGSMYTIIHQFQQSGYLLLNVKALLTLSGPQSNCRGYKETGLCTTDVAVTSRNSAYSETSSPEETPWCQEQCDAATFSVGLTVPHFYYIAFGLIGLSLPCIFCYLKEEPKQKTTTCRNILRDLYRTSQRQAVWQILLYTLVPLVLGTLLGVNNAAMTNANRVWLKLTTFQTTVIIIMDNLVLVVVLQFIRKKGLTVRFVDHLSYTSDTKSRLFDLLTQFTPSLSSLSPVSTDIFLEKNTTHRQSVPPLHQPYVPFDRVRCDPKSLDLHNL